MAKAPMRVFITAIGTRDPVWLRQPDGTTRLFPELKLADRKEARDGPVLSFFQHLPPPPARGDRIYLLSTAKGRRVKGATERGGKETRRALAERYPAVGQDNITHLKLRDVNPSDFAGILAAMAERVRDIIDEIGDAPASIIVNCSPGTPQMRAAWYSLWNAGCFRGELFEIAEESGAEAAGVRRVNLTPLVAEGETRQGLKLFATLAFPQAEAAFRSAASCYSGAERSGRQAAALLAGAYSAWDVFDHAEGAKRLAGARDFLAPLDGPIARSLQLLVDEQRQHLIELLDQKPPGGPRVWDLYEGACRERLRGRFIDCLWRSHAAWEVSVGLLAASAMEEATGLSWDPSDLRPALDRRRVEPAMHELIRSKFVGDNRQFQRLQPHHAARLVLEALAPNTLDSMRGDLEWLARTRGRSLHEAKAVTDRAANRAIGIAKAVAGMVPGRRPAAGLTPENVERAASVLGTLLRVS